MKKLFKQKAALIGFSLATIAVLATYWQPKTETVIPPNGTTSQIVVAEKALPKTAAQDGALNETPTLKTVSALPRKAKINAPSAVFQSVDKVEIYAEVHEKVEKIEKATERKNVGERWAAEFEMLKNPKTGQIPKGVHQKGLGVAKRVRALQLPVEMSEDGLTLRTLPTITTTVRGPNNYGGRTRAIAFDKRNPQIMLSGGVSSGVFRSIDGGATWSRITPAGDVHGVTAIAQDPRALNGDTWYFGTGEQNSSAGGTGASYLGFGMWKSIDNGLTWTALPSTQSELYSYNNDFDNISRIVIDPTNGAILVGAGETVMRSADGGDTWTRVVGDAAAGSNPTDIIYNAAVPAAFYASIHGEAANNQGGIYRSTDGIAWTKIRTSTELNAVGVKRIVLANVAATVNILAFYENKTPITCIGGGTSQAGLQLYDATAMIPTWTDHSQKVGNCAGAPSPKVISFQGGYNMCIVTKPNDGDVVYLGGVEIYRVNLATSAYDYIGGDQGAANATNLHVDNHLLLFQSGSNDILWAGNDGGMRRTDVTGAIAPGATGGYSWTDRTSGYITYQYYRADINPANGSNFVAGAAQDNAITLQASTAQAKEIHGGDGTGIGIITGTDFNTYNVIVATQEGNISRINNGTGMDIKPTGAAQGFVTYFLLDADNTNLLYYPTNTKKLYRTRNAAAITDGTIADVNVNWEEITGIAATLTGNISAMSVTRNVALSGANYTATAAARNMYIGTSNGKVYRFADPAFTAIASPPTEITPPTATGFVSDVISNPYNDKELLVTYSNYGVPSVWHTPDASVAVPTWTNVEGAAGSAVELASARSAMIVKTGATTLYMVGTSTGLYGTTTLSGATTVWERIAFADIAYSPSVSMRLRVSDNKMVLGTHGNGLFGLAFPAAVLPLDLLSFNATKNAASVQLKWASANEVNFSHYNVQKSNDGKNFVPFAKLKATGAGTYEKMDEKPSAGQNYYRLEMVDTDGKRKHSNIVNVTFDTKGTTMSLYPNPVQGAVLTLDVSVNKDSEFTFTVTDIAGRNRLTSQQKAVEGANQLPLDVSRLEQGVYFITTKHSTTQEVLQTMRFIKQ